MSQYRNACLRIDVFLEADGLVLLQILVEVAPQHLVASRDEHGSGDKRAM